MKASSRVQVFQMLLSYVDQNNKHRPFHMKFAKFSLLGAEIPTTFETKPFQNAINRPKESFKLFPKLSNYYCVVQYKDYASLVEFSVSNTNHKSNSSGKSALEMEGQPSLLSRWRCAFWAKTDCNSTVLKAIS